MADERIPAVRLENSKTWNVLEPALKNLVVEGRFVLGEELEMFEEAAAQTFGARWCVGTSSGTSALVLALRASGLPPGARVVLPANTFFATFEAVVLAGLRPVLVDHDEDYLIDFSALEDLDDVEAVIPVHLYGLPVDMTRLCSLADEKGWFILEDASQAHGATIDGQPVGSFGHCAAFSCYPTKNLGAWGDAGFVCGRDPEVERRIRGLRHHGQYESNVHSDLGSTERLDNLQALVLTKKLDGLAQEVEARRAVAMAYRERLADALIRCPGDVGTRKHAYHQFVVEVDARDEIRQTLAKGGVGTGIHYPRPVHLQPAAAARFDTAGPLTRAETSSAKILSLPMYAGLDLEDVGSVADSLVEALNR